MFSAFLDDLSAKRENLCRRCVTSASDREVTVVDPFTRQERRMLMFGSNNYLGLATHPRVRERAMEAIREYGIGVGGPPLLNGTTALHRELEERLAALKGSEDSVLFSSGYGANVGLAAGLLHADDTVCSDEYSHASWCDGIRMAGARGVTFSHNRMDRLEELVAAQRGASGDLFVAVEGVYSMDGDLAPLDLIVPVCKRSNAMLILDDAHGTGVMGTTGRGTAEKFGLEGGVDITVGTFSKVFAMTGGFVAASKAVCDYLRYFARSYMFSASLPPAVAAAVLAGLDVIEGEPEVRFALRANVRRAAKGLNELGFNVEPQAAIIPLLAPAGMNIRRAAMRFHEMGIFLNSVEYPAVPPSQQRFRVSLMATHTSEDIDRLLTAVETVWAEEGQLIGRRAS
jgi:glycine C-acetyltransferase